MSQTLIILLLVGAGAGTQLTIASNIDGPLKASANPHYFQAADGRAVILNASQTWNTFQDWGQDGAVEPLDFAAFVKFLAAHGHNFTLLWTTEMPKFCGLPTTANSPPDFVVTPLPWIRTGPGKASDGGLKFDLNRLDPSFFERMRQRVATLHQAGIYAGVYLFTGEWLNVFRCTSDGYPYTGGNNINGIDDGYTGGKKGTGSITMTAPNAITRYQDAYVERMIDTLNDLPNVLWIVSEEAPSNSTWWNDHQIAHIRAYEARKKLQHPIGYAALIGAPDSTLYNSDADWVAPQARVSPVKSCGSGKPACKVNVNDSDHSYWELWNDPPQKSRNFAWENFTRGNQVLFMDPYLVYYPREKRNLCIAANHGICRAPDARYDNLRDNLGYILQYARRLKLAAMTPRNELSSTGYCLAHTAAAGAEYLVYAPDGGAFRVDLTAMRNSRTFSVEWFNPSNGARTSAEAVRAGSPAQPFKPPFDGDAVLYLVDTAGKAAGARAGLQQ
ncbi:MAG TPA: putative collagen-binding domain-containing protein [Bryobacteraceae bacterium]|nr:putative collagen-binding domain-containing protein [Bryobacteraceae bacterium]